MYCIFNEYVNCEVDNKNRSVGFVFILTVSTFHRHIKDAHNKTAAAKAEGVRCVILVHSFNVASSYTFCYASSSLLNFPNKHKIFYCVLFLINVKLIKKVIAAFRC